MTSITDPNTSVRFTNAMEEIHNKLLQTCGELVDTTTELSQAESQFLKFAHGMYLYFIYLQNYNIIPTSGYPKLEHWNVDYFLYSYWNTNVEKNSHLYWVL